MAQYFTKSSMLSGFRSRYAGVYVTEYQQTFFIWIKGIEVVIQDTSLSMNWPKLNTTLVKSVLSFSVNVVFFKHSVVKRLIVIFPSMLPQMDNYELCFFIL